MSLPITLRTEAEVDLAAARSWYETKLAGLGDDFITSADTFFERIGTFPELYAVVLKKVRRGKLRRFPYVVYYRVLSDKIEIVAVLHGSRDQKTWRARIRKR